LINLKNQAENLIYNYDSTLSEQRELIHDEHQAKIATIKEEFNIACNSPHTSIKEVGNILDNLRQTLLEIGTNVYQQKNVESSDNLMFDDDCVDAKTDMDSGVNQGVKAVVSISNSANIESSVDFGLDDETSFDDYESLE